MIFNQLTPESAVGVGMGVGPFLGHRKITISEENLLSAPHQSSFASKVSGRGGSW